MFSYLLSSPFFFNNIRRLGVGDQKNTKEFVRKNLINYKVRSVLDLGCGTGDFIEAIPMEVDYLGVDMNERFIKYAIKKNQKSKIKNQKEQKDKYNNLNLRENCHAEFISASQEILNQVQYDDPAVTMFKVGNIMDVEFYRNRQFDAVLLVSMLHHFSDKELEIILPLIKKVTKKVVIIADVIPNPPNIFGKLLVKLDPGKFVRTEENKIQLINKYFKVVNTKLIKEGFAVQYGIVCEVN